jgi:hypothetical protein
MVTPPTVGGFKISAANNKLDRMARDRLHDPNADAARIVPESTHEDDQLAADMQAAWEAWSVCVQNVDERSATSIKAAFEAGYEAAQYIRRGKR